MPVYVPAFRLSWGGKHTGILTRRPAQRGTGWDTSGYNPGPGRAWERSIAPAKGIMIYRCAIVSMILALLSFSVRNIKLSLCSLKPFWFFFFLLKLPLAISFLVIHSCTKKSVIILMKLASQYVRCHCWFLKPCFRSLTVTDFTLSLLLEQGTNMGAFLAFWGGAWCPRCHAPSPWKGVPTGWQSDSSDSLQPIVSSIRIFGSGCWIQLKACVNACVRRPSLGWGCGDLRPGT